MGGPDYVNSSFAGCINFVCPPPPLRPSQWSVNPQQSRREWLSQVASFAQKKKNDSRLLDFFFFFFFFLHSLSHLGKHSISWPTGRGPFVVLTAGG